jgi:hypothetical protein
LEEKVVNYLRLINSRSYTDEEARQRAATELFDLLIKPIAKLLLSNKKAGY